MMRMALSFLTACLYLCYFLISKDSALLMKYLQYIINLLE